MKPITAPILGGMTTWTVHVLIVVPVILYLINLQPLRKRKLVVVGITL